MRPAEYPNETIIDAGLALQAAGRAVTGFALRQRVGGGNPARLKAVWDEHLANAAPPTAAEPAELPQEVGDRVGMFLDDMARHVRAMVVETNTLAARAAERQTAEAIRAANEQQDAAARELADAASTVEDLETALEATRAELDRARETIHDQTATIGNLETLATTADANLSTTMAQLAAVQAELDKAQDTMQHQAATIGSLEAAGHAAESNLATLTTQLVAAQAELDKARDSLQQQAVAIGSMESRASAAEASLAATSAQLAELRAALDKSRQERDEARERAARQTGQIETMEGLLEKLATERVTAEKIPTEKSSSRRKSD